MNKQLIVSMKNLKKLNKLLDEGWTFQHTVGNRSEFALLTKYRNVPNSGGLRSLYATQTGQPVDIGGC